MPSPSRYYSSNAAKTTLAGSIASSATSLTLAAASNLPAQYPYTLILEKDTANEEIVEVTSLVGSSYQITRNIDSSGAKAHAVGANVEHGVSARDFTESRAHEIATTSVHGISGDVVGTSGAQTLASKTLTTPTINGATISGTFTSTATISGGTITGASITGLAEPTAASSAATRNYIDTQTTSAAASATAAATSASSASTSASSAATSVASAATSAASAATSASSAATSASTMATSVSSAQTSASSAATSAASAATSASSAATSATSAANSATAAASSATTAAASVATIASYATAAASSATAAASSATSAAASYDAFDDRYLGSKASDPTLDNDGNALTTGALYFNTVLSALKVYNGTAWGLVAPDTSNFIDKAIFTAKGSLISASAGSTPVGLTAAATNGYILTISSATTSGLAWTAPPEEDLSLNLQTLSSNYTLAAGYNAHSVGPVTIATGITITIPTDAVWLIG